MAGGDCAQREEAVLELAGQNRPVLQVLGRLSLSVQYVLNALDDVAAMREEALEQFLVAREKKAGEMGK